jgi:predicted transport protein
VPINYLKPERLTLKSHPELNERWVQGRIAEDPTILGLGDLVVRDKERIQPRAGRLDLLLQDPETNRRYEVELQLGATDEAHIIRTIEYWDIERKRYPQYDHCAVLITEDITSRFLKVIALFNGSIPLIAIQMQALKISDHTTLVFTTVIDELTRGLINEDEDADAAPTDRAYWEGKVPKSNLGIADELLNIVHEFDPSLTLKYNKFYIGLAKEVRVNNFVSFRPQKSGMGLRVKLKRSDDIQNKIDGSGLETLNYDKWGRYRLRLTRDDPKQHADLLRKLIGLAHGNRTE